MLNLLGIAAPTGGSMDIDTILGSIVAGGAGGGVLMAIIGAINQAIAAE